MKVFLLPPASTQTEVVLLESESRSTAIELYLTVGNIKVNFDSSVKEFESHIHAASNMHKYR